MVRPGGDIAESPVANTALHEDVQSAPWEDDRDLFDCSDATAGSGDRETSGAAGADIGETSDNGQLDDDEVLSIRSGA